MSAERIDPELVHAAQSAYERAQTALQGPTPMEAALNVAFKKLGLMEEERGGRFLIVDGQLGPERFEHRLITRWQPVEDPS